MKKILTIFFALLVLLNFSCFAKETKSDIKADYAKMQKELDEKAKAIKSKADYLKYKQESKAKNEALLSKINKESKPSNEVLLIKGKILLQLRKNKEALELFENIIKKNPKDVDAKFGKVKALLSMRKVDEALKLFESIEAKLKKDNDYLMACGYFAYRSKDKAKYAQKLIDCSGDSSDNELYKSQGYNILADLAKEKGNIKKSMEILQKGIAALKSPRYKKRLESKLNQLKLIGAAAPEISAEKWINSKGLDMKKLKGKAVILDFFAPWCPPCRMVIPTLVKAHNKFKDKGLVIIGFTRYYGSYRDDKISKEKVKPEEEAKLIEEFCKRFKIEYPVAVTSKDDCFKAYGVSGLPTLVMITKDGKIKEVTVGAEEETELLKKIEELVK